MKVEIIIYKILSFLLLPVAALLAMNCLAAIVIALANPPILITVFLFACIAIYIIASYLFLTRGIDRNSPRKPVLRDWIRINGFITLLLGIVGSVMFTGVTLKPADAKMMLDQLQAQNHMQLGIGIAEFQKILNGFMKAMAVISIVLVVHVLITFHLMRRFRYLFSDGDINTDS